MRVRQAGVLISMIERTVACADMCEQKHNICNKMHNTLVTEYERRLTPVIVNIWYLEMNKQVGFRNVS